MKKRDIMKLILMVACSSVASQIYFNMFVDGFIVAFSVVIMGIFLYLFKDINSVLACALVGVFSPAFRLIIELIRGTNIVIAAKYALPDMAFFFSYAIIFGILFSFLGYKHERYYLRLVLSDFLSNCVEMSVRLVIFDASISGKFLGLIILAVIRSFIILLICIAFDYYVSLLKQAEHEKNYKKLVVMAATYSSEVYFMEKNMNEIEDVMKNAFTLYRTLEKDNYPKELQDLSLEISKDVHEIKKGYRRVIKGLQENFVTEFKNSVLSISDIFKILSIDVEKNIEKHQQNISFTYSYETNYNIQEHFSFMSIIRNLISNAIDAISLNHTKGDLRKGKITLDAIDQEINGEAYCVITVKDNGPGIADDIMDVLFEPGFSTKYDYETGDINRGVGLTLVKDLLEDKFNGEISVQTQLGVGTSFIIKLPVKKLVPENNPLSVVLFSE